LFLCLRFALILVNFDYLQLISIVFILLDYSIHFDENELFRKSILNNAYDINSPSFSQFFLINKLCNNIKTIVMLCYYIGVYIVINIVLI